MNKNHQSIEKCCESALQAPLQGVGGSMKSVASSGYSWLHFALYYAIRLCKTGIETLAKEKCSHSASVKLKSGYSGYTLLCSFSL
jgi:hypothetical protein